MTGLGIAEEGITLKGAKNERLCKAAFPCHEAPANETLRINDHCLWEDRKKKSKR